MKVSRVEDRALKPYWVIRSEFKLAGQRRLATKDCEPADSIVGCAQVNWQPLAETRRREVPSPPTCQHLPHTQRYSSQPAALAHSPVPTAATTPPPSRPTTPPGRRGVWARGRRGRRDDGERGPDPAARVHPSRHGQGLHEGRGGAGSVQEPDAPELRCGCGRRGGERRAPNFKIISRRQWGRAIISFTHAISFVSFNWLKAILLQ